jgi:hypothetical protein
MTKRMTVWIMPDSVSDLFAETLVSDSESSCFESSLRRAIERGLDRTKTMSKKEYDAEILKGGKDA